MSKFVRYKQCPRCAERGRDTARDNCAEYSDGSEHCFAQCGYHKFPTHYVRKTYEEVLPNVKKVLPADFTRDIPTAAWKWLLQYGLSYRYWEPYCGYSEKDQRLIFTVGTPTDFSIGRYVGDGEEKRKWFCYGDAHKTAHLFGDTETSKNIVLVEDLISAHKVGQITNCIPLFGTNVFGSVLNTLRLYKKPVVMWLDNDQKDHARKRASRLALLTGCDVSFIFTEKDAKCLSIQHISDLVL